MIRKTFCVLVLVAIVFPSESHAHQTRYGITDYYPLLIPENEISLIESDLIKVIREKYQSVISANNRKRKSAIDGPDIDVTYIERTPRYERYNIGYNLIYKPPVILNPSTKKLPDEGENVKFIAHVRNAGDATIESYEFRWKQNDVVLFSGTSGSKLETGAEHTYELVWIWESERNWITFEADADNLIQERCEINNLRRIASDSISLRMPVLDIYYHYFSEHDNMIGSRSVEDWYQAHIDELNRLLENSKSEYFPDGCSERVHLDSVLVINYGENQDSYLQTRGFAFDIDAFQSKYFDGDFGVGVAEVSKEYLLAEGITMKPPYPSWVYEGAAEWFFNLVGNRIDGGLIHELGHQLGLIDLYSFNVEAGSNNVTGMAIEGKYNHDQNGELYVMAGAGGPAFSPHSVGALNSNRGKRRGYYGEYLFDVPDEVYLQINSANGFPLKNALIRFHQTNFQVKERLRHISELDDYTNDNGIIKLKNREVVNPLVTDTGHIQKDNPFGDIEVTGLNGHFIIEISKNGQVDFKNIDLSMFNMKYWTGNTQSVTFTLETTITNFLVSQENIALNKPTKSSSNENPLLSSYAVNGVTNDKWQAWAPTGGLIDGEGEWWQVDLQDYYSIGIIEIFPAYNNPVDMFKKFRIDGSATGDFSGEEINVVPPTEWNGNEGVISNRFGSVTEQKVRFLRLTLLSQKGWGRLQEFRVFPNIEGEIVPVFTSTPLPTNTPSEMTNRTNLAYNRPVTASRIERPFYAECAVDGDAADPMSHWFPNGGIGDYLEIDLGNVYKVYECVLKPYSTNSVSMPREFRILLSETGEFNGEEKIVVNVKSWMAIPSNERTNRKFTFYPVEARYVRFVMDYPEECRIAELEVYGVVDENDLPIIPLPTPTWTPLPTPVSDVDSFTNVALCKPSSANMYVNGKFPIYITDGDLDNPDRFWSPGPYRYAFLQIDLLDVYDIWKLTLYKKRLANGSYDILVNPFKIFISLTGEFQGEEVEVVDQQQSIFVTSPSVRKLDYIVWPSVRGRYVRLQMTDKPDWGYLQEFEVYSVQNLDDVLSAISTPSPTATKTPTPTNTRMATSTPTPTITYGMILSGLIEYDLNIGMDRSPVLVDGDLEISYGLKWEISEGVIVYVSPGCEIVSQGMITANGTSQKPIVFTCSDKDRRWGRQGGYSLGMRLYGDASKGSYFKSVHFENGKGIGFYDTDGSMIDCVIRSNLVGLVTLNNCNKFILDHCILEKNTEGVVEIIQTTNLAGVIRINACSISGIPRPDRGFFYFGNAIHGDKIFINNCNIISDEAMAMVANVEKMAVPSFPIDARNNYWGLRITAEMNVKGYPANITKILDKNDESWRGELDYNNWRTDNIDIVGIEYLNDVDVLDWVKR